MAPKHHEGRQGAPRAGLADKEKPAKRIRGGRRRCPACGESSVQVGVSAERLQRTCLLLRPEGALLAPVSGLTPQGGAGSARPSFELHPYLRCSDRWRSGDGGVAARGDQLPTPSRHVSLPASGGHWGASVWGGSPTVGGPWAYPNVSSRLPPRQSPTLPGQHAPPGNHHLSGLRGGLSPPQSCILHSRRRAATLPIAQGMKGPLSPGPSHLPAPPFTHQCVCCRAIRYPTRPTSPGIATSRTCRGERRSPREIWFLEHFGRTVFAMGRTPLPEMSGPPHHVHLRPDTRPTQSTSQPQSRSTSLTRYDDSWTTMLKGHHRGGARRRAHRRVCSRMVVGAKKGRKAPSHGRLSAP
ncbi:hypothetical protein GWK47_041628 [Chionoecetes opilio]|uniref:Uncharacterized protein n=1 Tax=Chionoecetes opilio TaxID=41210 RepID=A0A8J5CK70_CHIOP|nr:hypothetical protein GWK47_041628 [Chionoecetes opilio]